MRVIKDFDELLGLVGQEIGVSDWITVGQDRIDRFAEATGDRQWIHVDVDRAAKEMPAGRTIAHGYLTLSLIPVMIAAIFRVEGLRQSLNYGSNRVRFTQPVPAGASLRGRYRLIQARPISDGGMQITGEVTVELEGSSRPACVAEIVAVLYR